MKAWTDYPILTLGDASGVEAPIRECVILDYDGDKYCRIRVGAYEEVIKRGYLNILAMEHGASGRGEKDIRRAAAIVDVMIHSDAVRAAVKAADAWGEEIRQKWPPAE